MRPKKRILLIDANEDTLARRRYLLTIHGRAVFSASTDAEALAICRAEYFDLAILSWPMRGAKELLDSLSIFRPQLPTLVLAEREKSYPAGIVATAILIGAIAPSEVVEHVKVLCARKRGPLSKTAKKPVLNDGGDNRAPFITWGVA